MTSYPTLDAWLDDFRKEPLRRLDRLFRRGDSISPFERGDPHDAALMALRSFGTADDRDAADAALAQWLKERLAEPLVVAVKRGWGAYVGYAMEGFDMAARMPGARVGAVLRDQFDRFDTWTGDLSADGPGDLRLRFLLALAHNQGNKRRFLGLWYALCDQAERSATPNLTLSVGLAGLRGLPPDEEGRPRVAEGVEGLCRWARHLPDSEEARERFLMQWRAFTGRHHRRPDVWHRLTADAVETYAGRPFVGWWRDQVGGAVRTTVNVSWTPSPNKTNDVVAKLKNLPTTEWEALVRNFINHHEVYASRTHDLESLPRAFNIVGNTLRRQKTRLGFALAAQLATTALSHVPNDENSWVLWAQATDGLGQRDVAESILWQAMERFPANAPIRSALAGLLAKRDRVEEAEALHRQTMQRIPNDHYAFTALASLLADQGRMDDALSILRNALPSFPNIDAVSNALANLLVRNRQYAEAEALYRKAMERFPQDPVCRLDLGLLLLQQNRRDDVLPILDELKALRASRARTLQAHLDGRVRADSSKPPSPAPEQQASPEWSPLLTNGMALRASFILSPALSRTDLLLMTRQRAEELRTQARELLNKALAHDPNNPLVRLIARRHGIKDAGGIDAARLRTVAGRNFPLRLELALDAGSDKALRWLYQDFDDANHRALTAAGWLLVSPYADYTDDEDASSPVAEQAARHLQRWLNQRDNPEADTGLGLLWSDLRNRLGRAVGGDLEGFLDAWQNVVAPATIRDLLDIALLGMVLAALPFAAYEYALAE